MNEAAEMLDKVISTEVEKIISSRTDRGLKSIPAKVISYDEDNRSVVVSFIESEDDNEYVMFNRCGERLSENDLVRVYYSSNPAKGWVGARMGEPDYIKETVPFISSKIVNTSDSEIGLADEVVFDLSFNVKDDTSVVSINANQILDITSDGTVNYSYEIDGERMEFEPSQVLLTGKNVFTHIIPMDVGTGSHNIMVKMNSKNANGKTVTGNFVGVISGQIDNIDILTPPNYKLKFVLSGVTAGTEITVPILNSDGQTGVINWGDGVIDKEFDFASTSSHTYTSDGDYTIAISSESGITKINQNSNTVNWAGCLEKIIFPDNILSINHGSALFRGLTSLKSVEFGKMLQALKSSFHNCTSLVKADIPTTLIYAVRAEADSNYGMFRNTGIKQVTLPKSLVNPTTRMYQNCLSLQKVDISSDISDSMFEGCSLLEDVQITNYCGSIGKSAFENCTTVKSVLIPSSVISIGQYAFKNCTSLNELTISNGVRTIRCDAFYNCTGLESVIIPSSVTEVEVGSSSYGGTFGNCSNLKDIKFMGELSLLSSNFARNCSKLSNVILPLGLTFVPWQGFYNCTSLKSIYFPETVTSIGGNAFWNSGLTSVNFHEGIDNIGKNAFRNTSLTNIVIPSSTTQIDADAFNDCSLLVMLTIKDGANPLAISNRAFRNTKLSYVELPDRVTYKSDSFPSNCTVIGGTLA